MENSYLNYKIISSFTEPRNIFDIHTLKCEGIFYKCRFTSLATRVNDGPKNSKQWN